MSERRDINRLDYDIKEAAAFLHKTERQLRELVETRQVASVKSGKYVYFRQCDLDAYVEGCIRPVRPQHQGKLPLGVPPG